MTLREAHKLFPDLPRLDREVLLSHVMGQDRVFLMAHGEDELTPTQLKRYQALLARAAKHEPIAYIIGEREFYGRSFSVGPGVLIPRPETELLVERALKDIALSARKKNKKIAVIDIGTGSGAIIISLYAASSTAQQKKISWSAVDIEAAALRYARKNARRHHASEIRFIRSDLLSRLKKKLPSYDEIFIAANLPYLSTALYRSTAPSVKRHEPKSALLSGTDGLDHYRRLLAELNDWEIAGKRIHFYLEISPEQARKAIDLFRRMTRLSSFEIIPDLAGKSRIITGVL